MAGPLTGVRVVDWTQYGVGPFATSLLGAMGASVIHVEAPEGDPQRLVPPTIDGVAACYINFNTSKRSVKLDLAADADRERMWQLIETSDVLVNNFRPSSVSRLGFDPAPVMARNPRLIYCVSNGWGETGPLADRPGSDPLLQVFGGWCSVTGEEGGEWEALRFLGHIDLNASMYIAGAVLTGLASRDRLGGRCFSVSMLEATLAMQSTRIAEYLGGLGLPGPLGSASSRAAPSRAFRCEDGVWVAVSAETEGQWQRLCQVLERTDLRDDPRHETNEVRLQHRQTLEGELSGSFSSRPAWWWIQRLAAAKVPCSRFWDVDLVQAHPQVRENGHVIELDTGRFGTVLTGGLPWKFSRAPGLITRNPAPGEHTAEVLEELDRLLCTGGDCSDDARGGGGDSGPLRPDRPFEGLRVLELATGIAGPYCGSLFADQGADVLKVEPGGGDPARAWGPAFVELNRNKRTTAGPGQSRLLDLAGTADVVVLDSVDPDGEPPPVDPELLAARHPRLVVCSLSAYGPKGPLAGNPGSELTVQAMANTWAGLGTAGGPPRRIGVDQAMMNAGLAAYQAVAAALFRRQRCGEGELVHVSALGTHHAVKGMHWTCMSHPDQWPGVHLTVWTGPEDHGLVRAADRPVQVAFSATWRRPPDPGALKAVAEHFGGELPAGMDPVEAGGPRWAEFWSSLFGSTPWEEVARVVGEHGGVVTPWMSYQDLDHHPHVAGLAPFAALEDDPARRVVRLAWRAAGAPPPLYRAPVAAEAASWAV